MRMLLKISIATLLAGAFGPPAFADGPSAEGWISHPAAAADTVPVVLHFRRAFEQSTVPVRFPIRVTADNRFILFVNGARVASGPSTGDVNHWRDQTIDIASHLRRGPNVVAAVVWNGVQPVRIPPNISPLGMDGLRYAARLKQTSPSFQQSVATGFRLIDEHVGASISTDGPGWRVKIENGRGFTPSQKQLSDQLYYLAAPPEFIDAAKSDFTWTGPMETGAGWQAAVPAPAAAKRGMVLDRLPPQSYSPASVGRVVRTDLPGGTNFPSKPVTIPANSKATLLIQRDAMISAYPGLDVSGGAGATVTVKWAEALYDEKLHKGDRNVIGNLKPQGIFDTFMPDGQPRSFETLWWRTWRYAEINVQTKGQPLTLRGMRVNETGYPFAKVADFTSSDPSLKRIFDIGWRTARVDAHETYMDSSYWEQLQYAGDARLQMLISYSVSGDPRLAEQAIDIFAASDIDGGLMDGAYPQRFTNVIAPFSLLWVGMLDDWRARQPDTAPLVRNVARMRKVLDWFARFQQPSGLLGLTPQWNFIDWAGQSVNDRTRFPSYGTTNESCLVSVAYLGALQQGARVEATAGDQTVASEDASRAERLAAAIRERCWKPARGLFADNPSGDLYSQHMNALAILYDVASPAEAPGILNRIVVPAKGIDAPEGMFTTSYYFAWYLAQAFAHAGQGDRYLQLLDTWRDLLKLNYTTWPEERGHPRSDTHAWSAHPTADLLGIVAGIGPGSAGYRTLRVAPSIGTLTEVDATAATPAGPVKVRYRVSGERLSVEIDRPASLPGEFVWRGRAYPLKSARTRLIVSR
ncbi:alpha-L-rhamnosidase-related protein [Sphingomonas melonis]|uniref:Alpha-L-rhamnosidase n=1 Tax=Sphingomonas melonis TaxID=152682 RepID=A0A7Y9K0R0_9SPHN|nr:alpha-L-rhamnosidase C-terminal domain-containing protein [Sphingomonas melonis]NYD89147.1 hypothetical protein [Sphingomonas melonis]